MKKVFSILLLCMGLFISSTPLQAAESSEIETMTIEYLSNGDYIIKEYQENISLLSSEKVGTCTLSYYTNSDVLVFTLALTATYDYTYGIQSKATSAEASVYIYVDNASFREKDAYTSGSTAYATAVVRYLGRDIRLNVDMSCDIYGNLS